MGVRGVDELLAVLPPAAAEPASAVARGLADLLDLRHCALGPREVRALGEVWERFTAQVGSGRLGVLAAMAARDDVIPQARVGEAGAVFGHHVLGQRRGTARRDAQWAGLLRPQVGDLPAVGAAFAAGDVSAAHVEVAVRAHRDLGAAVREALVDCQVPDADNPEPDVEPVPQLRAALAELSAAFTARVRQIRVVDALLAHYARQLTVAELEAIARRIVATLNPPSPNGAHQRRHLHMSQLPGGEWVGKFSCGPAQGLRLKRALAAWSAPRPGLAIDADGVEHTIPDSRDLGARQMDAVSDIVTVALAKSGITIPTDPNLPGTPDQPLPPHPAGPADPPPDQPPPGQPRPDQPPPPPEGEAVVLRRPGTLLAPYPSADLVLVAGIEHVAAAWAHRPHGLPVRVEENFGAWLRDRFTGRSRAPEDHGTAEHPPGNHEADETARRRAPGERAPGESPPGERQPDDGDLGWLGRTLSPYATPARLEHAGLVDGNTLELLACTATIRAALLAPNGALLDLGRSQRLASAAQKTALLARDGGCVIPGCVVPGDACEAHHVQWWTRQGPTDLDNLALVCGRHHTEVHLEEWDIQMRDGIPWVAAPTWLDRGRRLLRNAAHHPGSYAA